MEKSFSLFANFKQTTPSEITLDRVYRLITTDSDLRDRTEKFRFYLRVGNKQMSACEKTSCPAFTPAVRCEGGRKRMHIKAYTGLSLCDLDHIPEERMAEAFAAVCADPHVLLAYHTISDFKVGNYNARNYTVCYSAENHGPVWVAAPLHNCYVTKSGNRSYSQDPDVPAGIQPASKSLADPYNKGHMLGNRERSRTAVMRRQVCYYTNIAPQHSGTFNMGGGAWNNLEDLIDTYWDSTESANVGDTLYVVVGAYYKTWTDSYGNTASPKKAAFGGQQAGVPTMFYYAMLRTRNAKSGKSVLRCSREELQCAAFVMSHAMQKGHKPSRSDMRSVAEVERLSGFQFFTNVPNAPKDTYNPSDWGL